MQGSVATGVNAARQVIGGKVLSTNIIARPLEKLKDVLLIRYTEAVEKLRIVTESNRLIDLIGFSFPGIVCFVHFSQT